MVLSIALLGKYVHFPLSFFFCMISSVCIVMESTVINAVIWEQKKKKTPTKFLSLQLNVCPCMEIIFFGIYISIEEIILSCGVKALLFEGSIAVFVGA